MTGLLPVPSRLVASLIVGVTLVLALVAWRDVEGQVQQAREELIGRAMAGAMGAEPALAPLVEQGASSQIGDRLDQLVARAHLVGVSLVDRENGVLAASAGLADGLLDRARTLAAGVDGSTGGEFLDGDGRDLFAYVQPIGTAAKLVLYLDASDLDRQRFRLWRRALVGVLVQGAAMVLVTLLLVRWSVAGAIARTTAWLRQFRLGLVSPAQLVESEAFDPLMHEVRHLVKSLESARAKAEEEARLRDTAASNWTAERLRAHVRGRVHGSPLFVVSNREPYVHMRRDHGVEVLVPASGLVTALEPVLRACNGTWIAHGAGNADREQVDAYDRVRVPPQQPEYALRRVWLTAEEEEGYYYGFSNEGLWPLCHIAHARPLFRASDWSCYQRANQRFASAVIEELTGTEAPIVLLQDYHFALLPRLVKAARPDARVAIFWHIPWPNPEAFGICPWQREVLDGLLGADLVGFHTQAHCNNFLETVDRSLESQTDREHFTVRRLDHVTHVRPFPISVAFDEPAGGSVSRPAAGALRADLLKKLGTAARFLGVGVDRLDYTKGIIERFQGIERFLERWPDYVGDFTFVQIGAPSRTQIPRYQHLGRDVEAEAMRINARFQTAVWKPIVLLSRHHGHEEIERYYRAADVCLVTPLHDGMNLVSKEFVSARDDNDGVLILSQFTGAARELTDAVLVNPYDTEQMASAIHRSLDMEAAERRARMERMRAIVREHNVYRWAGTLIADLAAIRVAAPHHQPPVGDLRIRESPR